MKYILFFIFLISVPFLNAQQYSGTELYSKYSDGVVAIEWSKGGKGSLGAGFIVSSDGWIATNYHVVRKKGDYQVCLKDGRKLKVTKIDLLPEYSKNKNIIWKYVDLSLVKIDSIPSLKVLSLDTINPAIGEEAFAIGHPTNIRWTETKGIVSNIKGNYIQVDAPINEGNSGGPLINSKGNVIGISTWFQKNRQNMNYCLRSFFVKEALDRRKIKYQVENLPLISKIPDNSKIAEKKVEKNLKTEEKPVFVYYVQLGEFGNSNDAKASEISLRTQISCELFIIFDREAKTFKIITEDYPTESSAENLRTYCENRGVTASVVAKRKWSK